MPEETGNTLSAGTGSAPEEGGPFADDESDTNAEKLRTRAAISLTIDASAEPP
jgi:hypothetical protein